MDMQVSGYQLDVEVGRVVDARHHSVNLHVELWIDWW